MIYGVQRTVLPIVITISKLIRGAIPNIVSSSVISWLGLEW
jgi:hypothetical protein